MNIFSFFLFLSSLLALFPRTPGTERKERDHRVRRTINLPSSVINYPDISSSSLSAKVSKRETCVHTYMELRDSRPSFFLAASREDRKENKKRIRIERVEYVLLVLQIFVSFVSLVSVPDDTIRLPPTQFATLKFPD